MTHQPFNYVYRLWIKENSPLRNPDYGGPWISGAWEYIGSRVSDGVSPPDDFGRRYFSSGDFADAFRQHPEAFAWEILSEHATKEDAWDEEHRQIDNIWDSPSCANRHNQNRNQFRPTYDEAWLQKMKAGCQKRSQNPSWKHNHQTATNESNRKLSQDPEWQKNVTEANQKKAKDPTWQKNTTEAARKRSENPEWQKNTKDAGRKRAENPEWQKNHREAAQRPERNKKLSEARKRLLSEDPNYRQKMSEIISKKYQDPEFYEKMKEVREKNLQNPEIRQKMKAGCQKRSQNPDYLKKLSDLAKARGDKPPQPDADARRRAWVTRRARQAAASPQPPALFEE